MQAKAGDMLVIRGHRVGEHERNARIIEVRGPEGGPPYLIEWDDEPGEHLFFPGPEADVVHLGAAH